MTKQAQTESLVSMRSWVVQRRTKSCTHMLEGRGRLCLLVEANHFDYGGCLAQVMRDLLVNGSGLEASYHAHVRQNCQIDAEVACTLHDEVHAFGPCMGNTQPLGRKHD